MPPCHPCSLLTFSEKSGNALHTCRPDGNGNLSDYIVEFCPGQTDYVGTKTADPKYINATATCSNKVTSFTTEFSVGPSPTATKTAGTLQVVATVLPGVDGAAALQIDENQTNATANGSSATTIASGSSDGSSGSSESQGGSSLIYGSYSASQTAPPTAAASATATGSNGGPGSIATPPLNAAVVQGGGDGECAAGGQHKNGRQGGQYLSTEPVGHRKRVSASDVSCTSGWVSTDQQKRGSRHANAH